MLGNTKTFSGFSVDDTATAQTFYSETLGMNVTTNEMGILTLHPQGGGEIIVYPKDNHTPASFTILNFEVDNIDKAVDDLVSKGVTFLRYDNFPQDDRGVMRGAEQNRGPNIAWFNDPAGNVLALIEA